MKKLIAITAAVIAALAGLVALLKWKNSAKERNGYGGY
jgi:hypothetical protein